MNAIKNLVRKNVLQLKPYSSARDEYSKTEGIFLDANENPYGTLNRYPDPNQLEVKQELSKLKKVAVNNIFISNGSDEIIDLCFRVFCKPGVDKALSFSPSYGMYKVSAAVNDVELLEVPLDINFDIELETLTPLISDKHIKLIFICSPNNPTGNTFSKEKIEFILKKFNAIIILDEAYIDFSETESLTSMIGSYKNLLVCQTFSKAWGLAAARVGIGYADTYLISLLKKIKAPYNVSQLNQEAALFALKDLIHYKNTIERILIAKEELKYELLKLDSIRKVYPSQANFFLIESPDAIALYNALVQENIIIRQRHKLVPNCLRITVGTPEENKALINAIKNIDEKSFIYR